jgi:sterol desaturase/sphingolipid hydroxylase (fatty acid hydroxylase superfamily)
MEDIYNIDLTDFGTLLMVYGGILAILLIRYFFMSGIYYSVFLVLFKEKYQHRVLTRKIPSRDQIKRELKLSIYSTFVFGAVTIGLIWIWQQGYTQVYTDPYQYPLWYLPISIVIFLLLHDTYYYWLHKWMHHSRWLIKVHNAHHQSVNTTVWTSFSFHPVESFLQAVIVPALLVLVPMHPIAILVVLLIMTVSAIINHAGVEVYSGKNSFDKFRKYVIGATHHDIHHRRANKNFGLYFTFWDRLMKTEYEG